MSEGVFRPRSWVYYRRRPSLPLSKSGVLGQAQVTVTAAQLTWTKGLAQAGETDTAAALTATKVTEIGQATTTITADAISHSTGPGGTLMPGLLVEIAFNVGASPDSYAVVDVSLVDVGIVGAADVGGLGGTWTDVTDYVISGTIRRGTSQVTTPIPAYEAGQLSLILDNSDRRFDPTNLDGPYVTNEVTKVTPMRAIRVSAVWDDVTYPLFRGYIDMWDIAWADPSYSTATVTATDAFKVLANMQRTAGAGVGAGETTGARITRILDGISWSTSLRSISTTAGQITCSATTLADDPLQELLQVARTEIGDLYVDGSGKIVFRSRVDITQSNRSATSQATFGDDGTIAEMPYVGLGISNDDQTFFNEVKITRVDAGVEQTVSDSDSITLYLTKTFESTDVIMDSDAQALTYAQWVLATASEPELRFDSLEIMPADSPGRLYPQAFGRELSDRITIVRRPPGGGHAITRDVYIRGIEHSFAPMSWRTSFTLQKAPFGPTAPPSVGYAAPVQLYYRVRRGYEQRFARRRTIPSHRFNTRR